MDEPRKNAYRYLLHRAMLDIRPIARLRWRNPLRWPAEFRRIRRVGAVADWLSDMARFATKEFTGFDELRFWKGGRRLEAQNPEFDLEIYIIIFNSHIDEAVDARPRTAEGPGRLSSTRQSTNNGGSRMGPDDDHPHGWDYAWLATDAAGHVAVFTNAGQGPIPASVLANRPASDRAEELIEALPERGDGHILVEMPGPDDFVAYARRGLFACDWMDCHRSAGCSREYELTARPTIPVTVDELTPEVAAFAGRVGFPSLRFAETHAVAVDDARERP